MKNTANQTVGDPFVSNLCRAGVSPQTAQLLARHSDIKLTMNIYTHVAPEEQAAAIRQLPGLGDLKKDIL